MARKDAAISSSLEEGERTNERASFETEKTKTDVDQQLDDSSTDSLSSSDVVDERPSFPWQSRRLSKDGSSEFDDKLIDDSNYRKSNEHIEQLTINKLKFDAIGLTGRETETEILRSCLNRVAVPEQQQNRRKELVLISGYSGIGKSTLANTLVEAAFNMDRAVVARGKFDLNNRDEPYSGIASAFGEICQKIASESRDSGMTDTNLIGDTLAAELGSEVELLVRLIPELQNLLPASRHSSVNGQKSSYNSQAEQDRWKYAFLVLARVLNSSASPMIIMLDDLQWADVSSLTALEYLISDSQNPNALMIVGCFRSNEVDGTHILSSLIRDLERKQDRCMFNVTSIELGKFSVDEVKIVINELLGIDDGERTSSLAEICHRRTLGNAFFLIEFVTMLEQQELVTFNLGLLSWVWDEKQIENETMSTANVVDLLQSRMRRLSSEGQLLLQYAACIGATFDLSMLKLIWTNHAVESSKMRSDSIADLLTSLEDRHFVERDGVGRYRWVHDKVQEAALALGRAAEAAFQFEIGSILYHSLDHGELEDNLFNVVTLINKSGLKERKEFAALNLRAAEKARKVSAFHSASGYTSRAIDFLPSEKWTTHRDLTLRLYTLGAEIEMALGNDEMMEKYSSEILLREDIAALDKVPVYETKANKLASVELKFDETIDLCLAVLKDLGFRLQRKPAMHAIQTITMLIRSIRKLKTIPEEVFAGLGPMKDPKQDAIMVLLSRVNYCAYCSSADLLYIRSSIRMAKITLDHGVHAMSGFAFAALAIFAGAAFGDFATGSYLAKMALLMQKTVDVNYTKPITTLVAYGFVFPSVQPLQSCVLPLMDSYTDGMRAGNPEWALWCLVKSKCFMPFQMGKPLGTILEQLPDCAAQLEEFKQTTQLTMLNIYWQMMLNLAGRSAETTKLKGEILNPEKGWVSSPVPDVTKTFAQSTLYVLFGDFQLAADLALQCGDKYEETLPGYFVCMIENFHRGVGLYAMARRTNKRKYRRPAETIKKKIKWLKSGNPNVIHYHLLLCAEQAALDKDYKKAERCYQEAISSAARTGNLHHAALSNERYADFLSNDRGDEVEAKYRIGEAVRFYREWGADAKVEALMDPLI